MQALCGAVTGQISIYTLAHYPESALQTRTNVPVYQRTSVPVYQRTSVPAYQRTSVPDAKRSEVVGPERTLDRSPSAFCAKYRCAGKTLKKCRHRSLKKWHPDKNAGADEATLAKRTERTKRLNGWWQEVKQHGEEICGP